MHQNYLHLLVIAAPGVPKALMLTREYGWLHPSLTGWDGFYLPSAMEYYYFTSMHELSMMFWDPFTQYRPRQTSLLSHTLLWDADARPPLHCVQRQPWCYKSRLFTKRWNHGLYIFSNVLGSYSMNSNSLHFQTDIIQTIIIETGDFFILKWPTDTKVAKLPYLVHCFCEYLTQNYHTHKDNNMYLYLVKIINYWCSFFAIFTGQKPENTMSCVQ